MKPISRFILLFALVPPLLAGCEATRLGPGALGGPAVVSGGWPFAAESLGLLSLTRFDIDEDGQPVLYCYFELLDAWGHGVKAPGLLTVQMYREGAATQAEPELVWRADMNDPEANSSLYDEGTRAYRVPLGGVPSWATQGQARARIRVLLQTQSVDGRAVTIRDELVVGL